MNFKRVKNRFKNELFLPFIRWLEVFCSCVVVAAVAVAVNVVASIVAAVAVAVAAVFVVVVVVAANAVVDFVDSSSQKYLVQITSFQRQLSEGGKLTSEY